MGTSLRRPSYSRRPLLALVERGVRIDPVNAEHLRAVGYLR
jgi:hypothetical protein